MTDLNIAGVTAVRVRNDGALAKIDLATLTGQTVTLSLKIDEVFSLTAMCMELADALRVNDEMELPSHMKPTDFTPLPPVLHVNGFGGVRDSETGHLHLRVVTVERGQIQISLLPEDADRLFQLLLETQRFDGGDPH